jgi:hypothetical protein
MTVAGPGVNFVPAKECSRRQAFLAPSSPQDGLPDASPELRATARGVILEPVCKNRGLSGTDMSSLRMTSLVGAH